ncbi:MAG: hypothetical protein ABTD50_21910 [Polyangiaceae bacterium]|jgi:hypothetical protein
MASLASKFFAFDRRLAKVASEPEYSAWWREQLTRFLDALERGEATELWACTGRGGSKSTIAYKLALFFTIAGEFKIPNSQRHYAIILSRAKQEAAKGTDVISKWLTALGFSNRFTGDSIDLDARNTGIRVVSASVGAASGWRAFFVAADEYAKWNHEAGAIDLDASEILGSARAMSATHAGAPIVVCSSPWIDSGAFYDAISAGDGNGRIVAGPAASWVANPTISEQSARAKERNPRIFDRDYRAIFASEFSDGFFPSDAVKACTDVGRSPEMVINGPIPSWQHAIAIDPAFVGDRFALVAAHAEPGPHGGKVVVDLCKVIGRTGGQPLSPDVAVATTVRWRKLLPGMSRVVSDQHEASSLAAAFQARGVSLAVEPWTMANKLTQFSRVRNLMVDGRLRLPDDPELRRELSGIGLRCTPSGNETIGSRTAHDDRATALVACVCEALRFAPWAVFGGHQVTFSMRHDAHQYLSAGIGPGGFATDSRRTG